MGENLPVKDNRPVWDIIVIIIIIIFIIITILFKFFMKMFVRIEDAPAAGRTEN